MWVHWIDVLGCVKEIDLVVRNEGHDRLQNLPVDAGGVVGQKGAPEPGGLVLAEVVYERPSARVNRGSNTVGDCAEEGRVATENVKFGGELAVFCISGRPRMGRAGAGEE